MFTRIGNDLEGSILTSGSLRVMVMEEEEEEEEEEEKEEEEEEEYWIPMVPYNGQYLFPSLYQWACGYCSTLSWLLASLVA